MTDLTTPIRRLEPELQDDWGTRWIVACSELVVNRDQRTVLLMLLAAIHPKISGKRLNALGENARIDERGMIHSKLTRNGVESPGADVPIMPVDKLNGLLDQMLEHIQASETERVDIRNRVQGWIVRDQRTVAEHVERMRDGLTRAGDGIELSDFEPEDFKK